MYKNNFELQFNFIMYKLHITLVSHNETLKEHIVVIIEPSVFDIVARLASCNPKCVIFTQLAKNGVNSALTSVCLRMFAQNVFLKFFHIAYLKQIKETNSVATSNYSFFFGIWSYSILCVLNW